MAEVSEKLLGDTGLCLDGWQSKPEQKNSYLVGAHLSIDKGIHTIQQKMDVIDASTCALFLKSQRTYSFKKISEEEVKKFRESVRKPEVLLPHSSYLVNLANPGVSGEKGLGILIDDMERCRLLGIKMYNIHPGSDVERLGKGALRLVSDRLNRVLSTVPDVTVLVENMAGQGSAIGVKFEELRDLLDGVVQKDRVGICLDTCHLFGAGYDIRTEESFRSVIERFGGTVGIKYLKAMHLNDSKGELGSRKDRHESIGKGMIGLDAFKFVMRNDIFRGIPLILETPDPERYKEEVGILRGFAG